MFMNTRKTIAICDLSSFNNNSNALHIPYNTCCAPTLTYVWVLIPITQLQALHMMFNSITCGSPNIAFKLTCLYGFMFRIYFIYIYKEELSRTVVCEVLPQATANGHQTSPDYGRHTRSRSMGGDVHEEATAEECTANNLQTTICHLGFTEKIYGFLGTLICCQYKKRTCTVVRKLLPRASTNRDQTFPAIVHSPPSQYIVVDKLK